MSSAAVKTAQGAKKAALSGVTRKSSRKIRTVPRFYRPKTLRLTRAPKYPRKCAPALNKLDAHAVIKHPLNTESAMRKIEDDKTLVFIVDVKANKKQIAAAVKRLYDVECAKINTLIR
jgi:large subunit ribosomal protein L23Ae